MNLDELAKLHANDFPGYRLVDQYEAAFPSYAIQIKVMMEVKRPLGVLEEFILKSIEAGQKGVPEIAGILGLEHSIVEIGLDKLQQRNCVYFEVPKNGQRSIPIFITAKGWEALRELYMTEPEPSSFSVCLDAITGLLYPIQPLRQANEINKQDLHDIQPFIPKPTTTENLDFFVMKRLFAQSQKETPVTMERRELVDLREIEKSWTAYRVMRVLQYVNSENNSIQVQVYDRGERSMEHEAALLTMEAKKRQPLRSIMKKEMPPEDPNALAIIETSKILAARQKALEEPRLNAEIASRQQALEQVKTQASSNLVEERREAQHAIEKLNEEIARLQAQNQKLESESAGVQALQMHKHRPLLFKALQEAHSRVLIISPWLRPDAVDYELRQAIGEALKRGVDITIGYGFGEQHYLEKKVVEKLIKMRAQKNGGLHLHRVGDVHSKVLICDNEFMVLSSYNWLSFGGDPARGSRVEDGMWTNDKSAIEVKTKEWQERLAAIPETN